MSRWDLVPTPYDRWLVRHRTKFRVGAVLLMVVAIYMMVHVLMTEGFDNMAIIVPISAFASSISMLLTVRRVSSFVEKHDSAPHQRPNLG